MTSAVDICNQALGAIGARTSIASLSESSAEAQQCALYYTDTVKRSLRAAHWGFARKFANLSLLKALPGTPENTDSWDGVWSPDLPPPPWLYTYAYPTDCLQVRFINETMINSGFDTPLMSGQVIFNPYVARPARFEIGIDLDEDDNQIKTINTNSRQAVGCYTVMIENVDLWDSLFNDVVTNALSAALAMPLVGSRELEKLKYQIANSSILTARVRDGNEGLTKFDAVPDWLAVRDGPGYSGRDPYTGAFEYGPLFS